MLLGFKLFINYVKCYGFNKVSYMVTEMDSKKHCFDPHIGHQYLCGSECKNIFLLIIHSYMYTCV